MKPLRGVNVSIDVITMGLMTYCCVGSTKVRRLLLDYDVEMFVVSVCICSVLCANLF